jgi:hypothetical protein
MRRTPTTQEKLRKRRQSEGYDFVNFDYPPATFFRFDPLPPEDSNQEYFSDEEEEVRRRVRLYALIPVCLNAKNNSVKRGKNVCIYVRVKSCRHVI